MQVWMTIKGYKNYYQVSTNGLVKSLPRLITRSDGQTRRVKGKILSCIPKNYRGNIYTVVALCKKGRTTFRYVHRIVAETFIPNPKNRREVNHKNLNKTDNKVTNLEWRTPSGNKRHAVTNGVKYNPNPKKGEDCTSSVLSWKKVRKIRRWYKLRIYTQRELANIFHVTQANIGYIVNHKTWIE